MDVITVQELGQTSAKDEMILRIAYKQKRVIYTQDTDFIKFHSKGNIHAGILYNHPLSCSIGEAIRKIINVCEKNTITEMENRLEFI